MNAQLLAIIGAPLASFAVLYALGVWLWPRRRDRGNDHGRVELAGLPWRDYEDTKRKGCVL